MAKRNNVSWTAKLGKQGKETMTQRSSYSTAKLVFLTNVVSNRACVCVSFTTPGSNNLFSTSAGHKNTSVSTSEICAGPGEIGDSIVIVTGLTGMELGGVIDD
jgi:hypothetical protein